MTVEGGGLSGGVGVPGGEGSALCWSALAEGCVGELTCVGGSGGG